MQKGFISKILEFHYENFPENYARAIVEFFESDNIPDEFYKDSQVEGMFTEWFVFDYKMINGRSVMENYLKENFDDLSKEEVLVYKDLLDSEYGFFVVKDVKKGKGLTLESVNNGKIYKVKEKNGSKIIEKKEMITTRVGKVGNHWELVGSDGLRFGEVDSNIRKAIKLWYKDKYGKLTPKEVYREFYKNKKNKKPGELQFSMHEKSMKEYAKSINPPEVKKNFQTFLETYNLDRYFNVDIVQGWLYDLGLKNSKSPFRDISDVMFVFHSLIEESDWSEEVIDELMSLLSALHNITPLKQLKGKTPKEMVENELPDDYRPQIEMSTREFNLEAVNNFNKAAIFIQDGKIEKARKIAQKGLRELYEDRLVYKESFRIFANLAAVYITRDNLKGAEQLVDMALSLNPNYSFGQKVKGDIERIKKEIVESERKRQKVPEIIWEDILSSRDRLLAKNSPEVEYYNFLKKTKINFSTDEATREPKAFFRLDGKKMSRNEPCPCGSGKKYKKCCLRV